MRVSVLLVAFLSCLTTFAQLQTGLVQGRVADKGAPVQYVTVQLEGSEFGAITDEQGAYRIVDIPFGTYNLVVRSVQFKELQQVLIIGEGNTEVSLDLQLEEKKVMLDQMVVTGTKTFKRQTDSPIIVGVINSQTLEGVQACNLSDALNFQTGLRVETDCQTCNYTQLRMNGLGGGYSQILINGRPLFSPLTGLYGLEQIPVNMIDRVETVRGGGSSLYGSSAIGGTVNVITKIPREGGYDLSYTYQHINGQTSDAILSGNASVLSRDKKSGVSIFINNRSRGLYDHNGDNFSELPALENNSFGSNLFFKPDDRHKLEISIGSLNEYRYGGEVVDKAAHLALQSEERQHNVLMASADYQVNFNDQNSSFITYVSGQSTDREHYTGIFPDEVDSVSVLEHLTAPPYGFSRSMTAQAGVQLNHRVKQFISGDNVFTLGGEFVLDDVYDEIESYRYLVDQRTENLGTFLQSDWEVNSALNILSGLRVDLHNLLDKAVLSPRLSVLYKWKEKTQFRATYSTGFRAPQAFDADLHIAFAGGGISRISLSPNLIEERSKSFSASVNYDKVLDNMIYGFTAEGFYTKLDDAFYQQPIGEDEFGERFEKRNGDGATVKGISMEGRVNFNRKLQVEAGFTMQSSNFDSPVDNIEGLPALRRFLRTPDEYGFVTVSILPEKRFSASMNLVYTGEMTIAHFAGAPEQDSDVYFLSSSFSELGFKGVYTFNSGVIGGKLELFGGVKNLFNSYQDDFDSGKNRDSNYIYGPASPRTVFIGLRLKSS